MEDAKTARAEPRPPVNWADRVYQTAMAIVSVQVWDATGNKRQEVEMPDDAPVNRLIAVLLQKMNFPQYAPDGQPLSYKIHHRASGKQLLDGQTLGQVGVKSGDILRLQPEITAGEGGFLGAVCGCRCDRRLSTGTT